MMTGIETVKPYRGIADPGRIITCRLCDWKQAVAELINNRAKCFQCRTDICIYCGCSDERGCIHPSFPNGELICEWQDHGLCSFCFYKFAEEQYLVVTGRPHLIVPIVNPEVSRVKQ